MDFVDSYKDLFGKRLFTSFSKLMPGTVIQFTYDREQKYALVLDPEWDGKMHALSLKTLSPDGLKDLLAEVKDLNSRDEVYAKYKSSQYTESRPYRTYKINKISGLREIYLKEIPIQSEELKVYTYVRNFYRNELENEIDEYFENEYTLSRFPNLAESPEQLGLMIVDAPQKVLTKAELLALDNSDVGDVLKSKNPLQAAKEVASEYGRDINRILDAINNNTALPMPIVIRGSAGNYLMAGNTRLCSMAGFGYTMPVKVLTFTR